MGVSELSQCEVTPQVKRVIESPKTMFKRIRAILLQISRTLRKISNQALFLEVCRQENLSQKEIDLLAAVINCESGFNDKAINKNRNNTTDFGICQFNDFHYWKNEQIIHPDIALNNPKVAIRTMIRQYKKGRLKDWVCYSSGLWRKFRC